MVNVMEVYTNEKIMEDLKPLFEQKKLVMDNGYVFFREENQKQLLGILEKFEDSHESIHSLEQQIEWLNCGDYIEVCGKELYKQKCIDKLISKLDENNQFEEEIFNIEDGKVFDYLKRQIDLQFIEVLEDEINEMRDFQKSIKSGERVAWR